MNRSAPVGDRFAVHMDHRALGDLPRDQEIAWTLEGRIKPPLRHLYGHRLEPADAGYS